MKINGQFQWTDYLNAQLLHLQPNGFGRVVLYGAFSIMILTFIALLSLYFFGQLDVNISLLLPVFILILLFPLYRYVFLPNRVKKIFMQQKELSSPIEFEFTETGLHTSNEFGNSTRPWSYFIKWKENKELIMLYHSDVLFNMIPKRFFTDPQQIETVKSYLENNKVPKPKSRLLVGCVIYLVLVIVIGLIVYVNLRNAVSP